MCTNFNSHRLHYFTFKVEVVWHGDFCRVSKQPMRPIYLYILSLKFIKKI